MISRIFRATPTHMVLAASLLLFGCSDSSDNSITQRGLNNEARAEIIAAGGDKYLGTAVAEQSDYGIWTKHTFDPKYKKNKRHIVEKFLSKIPLLCRN